MDLEKVSLELDDLAVHYFEVLEELSEQRRRFEHFLREGFFNLSKARYSMGNQAVGSLQYDSNAMKALAHVVINEEDECQSFDLVRTKALTRSERKSLEGNESITNQQESDAATKNTVTRRRKAGTQESGDGVETLTADMKELNTSNTKEKLPTDPLLWFGVLVPQALRHGQQNFVEAIEACTVLASLQNKLDDAHSQYCSKLKEKRNIIRQDSSNLNEEESQHNVIKTEAS